MLSDIKSIRRQYLKENYLFECTCTRCEEEETEDEYEEETDLQEESFS